MDGEQPKTRTPRPLGDRFWIDEDPGSEHPPMVRCECERCGAHVMKERITRVVVGDCPNCGSYELREIAAD